MVRTAKSAPYLGNVGYSSRIGAHRCLPGFATVSYPVRRRGAIWYTLLNTFLSTMSKMDHLWGCQTGIGESWWMKCREKCKNVFSLRCRSWELDLPGFGKKKRVS